MGIGDIMLKATLAVLVVAVKAQHAARVAALQVLAEEGGAIVPLLQSITEAIPVVKKAIDESGIVELLAKNQEEFEGLVKDDPKWVAGVEAAGEKLAETFYEAFPVFKKEDSEEE